MTWRVEAEPKGDHPGVEVPESKVGKRLKKKASAPTPENLGGVILYVTDGSNKQEVTRVAYVRSASEHPKLSFEDALDAEMAKAQKVVDTLNDLGSKAGALQ